MSIKAVVLAAGKGTRMKSDKPKVLHEIFDKSLLGYVLNNVQDTGKVDESFVIVGHQADLVEKYIAENYSNVKTKLQLVQLGTGHAVSMVCEDLEDFDGDVIILCGDTPLITSLTLESFLKSHKNNQCHITVMTSVFDNPTGYGRILRNVDGSIKAIVEEKDATADQKAIQEVNAGIYCLKWQKVKEAFNELKTNNAQGEYYLTDIIAWGAKKKLNVQGFKIKNNQEILGINSKVQLAEAVKILNKRALTNLMNEGVTIIDPDNTWISPETTIGADTIVFPNTFINGKNVIGKACKIGPFAHIRGNCKIGDNVRIGNFVEIKKSEIADNTNVSHLSYIGDSELGSNVNVGAGTITANYNPVTKVKSKTIIKDNANTGSNSVLVAPVTVAEKGFVGAGTVVTKDVEAGELALTRAKLKTIKDYVK